MLRLIYIILFFTFFSLFAQTEKTVEIKAAKDNTLYEDASGAISNGAGAYLFTGNTSGNGVRRALIQFDITSEIPAGSTIKSISLTLNMSKTPSSTGRTTSLHKVLADWGEGASNAGSNEGGGASATNNDATWIHTFFNTDFWNTPGGDFNSQASASLSVAGNGKYTWSSTPELVNDVQDWLDSPETNFGWLILGDESVTRTAKRFDSRENSNESNRPVLSVTYEEMATSINSNETLPDSYSLGQNYPNPFNPATNINYNISQRTNVLLTIYDSSGKKIIDLVNEAQNAGSYSVSFIANNLSSGIYFYRLQAGSFNKINKMILVK